MLELGKFQYKACVGLIIGENHSSKTLKEISIQGLCRFNLPVALLTSDHST